MQRRINTQPKEAADYQALIDHKQATLNVILSGIPDISTFALRRLGKVDHLCFPKLTQMGRSWASEARLKPGP
jgi:hypothetical protein